jgi:uncharacterized membrane protein YuzA (DUF378 family)
MYHYAMKKLFMVAMLVLVIGGLNVGIIALTGKNMIAGLTGKNTMIINTLFLAVGLSAIFIGFTRDSYLPFLGPSVMPCSLLKVQVPEGADFETQLFIKPGVKVLYWAAEPTNKDLQTITDWQQAYLQFRNAGVAVADEEGYVKLRVRKPQPYTVPIRGELPPHIHYRVCFNNGFIGPVETVTVEEKEYYENYTEPEEQKPTVPAKPVVAKPVVAKPTVPNPDLTKDSLEEVNKALLETEIQSIMPADGAIVESIFKPSQGADYNLAYTAPQ